MSELTLILGRIENGEARAGEELLPLVYAELRRLAAAKMADQSKGHTLQATALVHEAYLRLVGSVRSGLMQGVFGLTQHSVLSRHDLPCERCQPCPF